VHVFVPHLPTCITYRSSGNVAELRYWGTTVINYNFDSGGNEKLEFV
jgi:hypothetical protein